MTENTTERVELTKIEDFFPIFKKGCYVRLDDIYDYRIEVSLEELVRLFPDTFCNPYRASSINLLVDVIKETYADASLSHIRLYKSGYACSWDYEYNESKHSHLPIKWDEEYDYQKGRIIAATDPEFRTKGAIVTRAKCNDRLHELMLGFGFQWENKNCSSIGNRVKVDYFDPDMKGSVPVAIIRLKEGKCWFEGYEDLTLYNKERAQKCLEAAKKIVANEQRAAAEKTLLANSIDGKAAILIATEGSCGDVPEHPDWKEVWCRKVGSYGRDHRLGIGATNIYMFLHSSVQEHDIVRVNVPDEFKGMFIGKQGSNIKRLCDDNKIIIKIVNNK